MLPSWPQQPEQPAAQSHNWKVRDWYLTSVYLDQTRRAITDGHYGYALSESTQNLAKVLERQGPHLSGIARRIRTEQRDRLEPFLAQVEDSLPPYIRQPYKTPEHFGKLKQNPDGSLLCDIRWMNRGDFPEVLHIEQQTFEEGWDEEDFLRALRHRSCVGMVAEHQDTVVASLIYELFAKHFSILTVAVHPSWRRLGVGDQIVQKMASKLSPDKRTAITTVIRETNMQALKYFGKRAFKAKKVLRGHFEDTGEDGVLMTYGDMPDDDQPDGGSAGI